MQATKAEVFTEPASFFHINWWADPAILGKLPQPLQGSITLEELAIIHQQLDFFGYNCYHSSDYDEYNGFNPAVYPGMPRTAMYWPITADALYWAAKLFTERYDLPLLGSENGMANGDFLMRTARFMTHSALNT